MEVRISLSEEQFKKLVAGEIVDTELPNPETYGLIVAKVALQDIGFKVMLRAIYDAMAAEAKKNREAAAP